VVLGDANVQAGSTLTIEAGVEVRFAKTDSQLSGLDASRVELTVQGSLVVNGTTVAPVTFLSDGAGAPNDWYGIVVQSSASEVTLTHLSIRDAREGLRMESPGSAVELHDAGFFGNGLWDLDLIGSGAPGIAGSLAASRVSGDLTVSGFTLAHNGDPGLIDGNLEILPGADYVIDVDGTAVFDQLAVQGTVTLGGSLTVFAPPLAAQVGDSMVIVANDGSDPVLGTFQGLAEGAQVDTAGGSLQISYAGADGNDVVLTVVDVMPQFADGFETGDTSHWSVQVL